jgi:hypothetical protein
VEVNVMRSREARSRLGRLARCARWLGLDRNPLRRGTDRAEALLRLAMILMLLVAVPIAAVAVGRQADHIALRRAHAQQAADHQVRAVLLEAAPSSGIPDPYTSIQTAWVPARWQLPGQPARTGDVEALVGARKGSTVTTWVTASGAETAPPPDHRMIAGDVCIAVTLTCLASWLVLLILDVLTRRALDRRRMRAWETEWRTTGPLWSGHRS